VLRGEYQNESGNVLFSIGQEGGSFGSKCGVGFLLERGDKEDFFRAFRCNRSWSTGNRPTTGSRNPLSGLGYPPTDARSK